MHKPKALYRKVPGDSSPHVAKRLLPQLEAEPSPESHHYVVFTFVQGGFTFVQEALTFKFDKFSTNL